LASASGAPSFHRLSGVSLCQRFLRLFSIRFRKNGRNLAHLEPNSSYFDIHSRSSASVHRELLTSGQRCILSRSRHWRVVRFRIWAAMPPNHQCQIAQLSGATAYPHTRRTSGGVGGKSTMFRMILVARTR
jgi:hypothetical protein